MDRPADSSLKNAANASNLNQYNEFVNVSDYCLVLPSPATHSSVLTSERIHDGLIEQTPFEIIAFVSMVYAVLCEEA